MNKQQIIILTLISIVLILAPFITKFMGTEIFNDAENWGNFSIYVNGLLMPILTVANLFILTNVNTSIRIKDDKFEKLYKKLKQQVESGKYHEFRVDIEKQETIEDSLTALNDKVNDLYNILDTLSEEVGDKNFEMVCLATPNSKARLDIQIAQLKMNIYRELFEATRNSKYEERLEKAMGDLQKLHRNTYLTD